VPDAFGEAGAAFGIAYAYIVLVHAGLFSRGASAAQAIRALAPWNFTTGALVLAGGIAGGDTQYVLWAVAGIGEWITPRLHDAGDFTVSPSHFVERHGLVLIVALGESVVAIGIGAAGLPVDAELVAVAALSLLLSAGLWWLYFGGDDEAAERALLAVPPRRRAQMALDAFGYWLMAMLLAVIVTAAGVKKAIGHPFDELHTAPALMLGGGVALFIAAEVMFRRTLSIEPRRVRTLAWPLALATVPLGLVSATVQIAALVAVLAGAIAVEARRR
jgi:low temperature requirement protein LtrA